MKLKNPVSIGVCFPALARPTMQRRKGGAACDYSYYCRNILFAALRYFSTYEKLYEIKKTGPRI
jgi:hypothetical protein